MTWELSSECISTVILCIIWVYSRKGNPVPSLKNRMFQACFIVTFSAMTSNILSTLMLYQYKWIPIPLIEFITLVYFVATPLMGVAYYYYAVSLIYEDKKGCFRLMVLGSIPAVIYLAIVLSNPFTGWIFDISLKTGYTRGPLIILTYLIFYFYCLCCVLLSVVKHRCIDRSISRIVTLFPIIAVVVIIIQQVFPNYILSGSAATCALLLIYLYLQNKQISIDYLTGIPNRKEFMDMLQLKLKKNRNEPFTVIVLSLKGFKNINDSFGQQSGDLLLQSISSYLQEAVKPYQLYRFSGDEFAALIGGKQANQIEPMLRQIMDRMLLPWKVNNYSCLVSEAIAVLGYPETGESIEEIINGIEYTISRSKRSKERSCTYFTPEMKEQYKRYNAIVDILKDSLKNDSFQVYYQPILSIATGKFCLAESLLRLNHTPLGPIYPNEFIPIAEDTGLIIPITHWVLNRVCRFIRKLMDDGIEIEGISVNFSLVQFQEENLEEKVLQIISHNKIPCTKIKIEFTESMLANSSEQVLEFMDHMHDYGIRFGLDDFGTGYSNISSVLKMPMDTVKLDKSLIWAADQDQRSALMISHLAKSFKALGMRVLAEGVETPSQSQFVVECSCDMIQGFLYARPLPEEEALRLLGRTCLVLNEV